jgi:hypothetical protein
VKIVRARWSDVDGYMLSRTRPLCFDVGVAVMRTCCAHLIAGREELGLRNALDLAWEPRGLAFEVKALV